MVCGIAKYYILELLGLLSHDEARHIVRNHGLLAYIGYEFLYIISKLMGWCK